MRRWVRRPSVCSGPIALLTGEKAASHREWDVNLQAKPASPGTLVALAWTQSHGPSRSAGRLWFGVRGEKWGWQVPGIGHTWGPAFVRKCPETPGSHSFLRVNCFLWIDCQIDCEGGWGPGPEGQPLHSSLLAHLRHGCLTGNLESLTGSPPPRGDCSGAGGSRSGVSGDTQAFSLPAVSSAPG